jgi:predicted nucleic acid-binding protein
MSYVIDCSFSSALFLPDENSCSVRDFFLNLKNNDQVFIPLLWWYETNNVLSVAAKRNRLKQNDVFSIINLFNELKLVTDCEYGIAWLKTLFELTQLYHISSYDAAYLELALRMKAKLMTLDNRLKGTAAKMGVD